MRCPSCGTENAPGSRFCGGCGARLAGTGARVAPTQKITDDASFPAPSAPPGHGVAVTVPGIAPIPPTPYTSNGPTGTPQIAVPAVQRSSSAAPSQRTAGSRPQRPITAAPPESRPAGSRAPLQLDDPSMSLPIAVRRPWGLIVVVLVVDLGLAVAGGLMLKAGLDDGPGSSANPSVTKRAPSPAPRAVEIVPVAPGAARRANGPP